MGNSRKTVFACVVLGTVILLLAIHNDVRFNEKRTLEAREESECDSVVRAQMEELHVSIGDLALKVDSVQRQQKEQATKDSLSTEAINQNLGEIKRLQRKMQNERK